MKLRFNRWVYIGPADIQARARAAGVLPSNQPIDNHVPYPAWNRFHEWAMTQKDVVIYGVD